jgi:hypothetical protein
MNDVRTVNVAAGPAHQLSVRSVLPKPD